MNSAKVNSAYYSQFGEDEILAKIFNEKNNGLCIEVGANDGINDSTTMYFEKIGWDCILVEPNPVLCNLIRASRSATLVEVAASDRSGEATLFVAEGAERAHGVSTISSSEESLSKITSYGFSYREIKVQTKTLEEILNEVKLDGQIDFISIDVEGHELEVLKGFSVERWSPTVILLEDNSNYDNPDVSDYLRKVDYLPFLRTGVNNWYAHRKNRKLVNFYSRGKYNWNMLKVRAKKQLKKIPGVARARKLLKALL